MGCIYMWTNKVNNKRYIGKCHDDVNKRKRMHLLGHGNKLLKRAFDKYGVENFTFEILHDGILDEFLNDYEIAAIKKYNTNTCRPNGHGYNLTDGGEGIIGFNRPPVSEETRQKMSEAHKGKTHSEETRKKLSEVRKGKKHGPPSEKTRLKISEAQKGKKISVETRRKLSETHKANPSLGFKGKTHSEETRRKLSEINKGKKLSTETKCKLAKTSKGRFRNPHRKTAEAFYFSLPDHLSPVEKWITFRKAFSEIVNKSTLHRWFHEWDPTQWTPDDTQRKQSVAAKNRPPISEETRRKHAKASTGRHYSAETRRKMSEAHKGKKASAETRRKLSAAHKGRTPPNKSPDRIPARKFFLSLPPDMSLREKRRLLIEKFPDRHPGTLYGWVKEWTQDT